MPSAPPIRASIIIVSYNSRPHLERGLASVMDTLNPADEVVLVDNASTDGSVDWIKRSFPPLRVIEAGANLGFGGGNNLGARLAKGEFLVFLNPDTIVAPGWLNPLLAALRSDARAGAVTSKILLMEERGTINTCGNDLHLSGVTLCRGMGKEAAAYPRLEEVAAVSGAAFAMRRDLFLELGGFDEDFFLYMEDTDLSLRVRQAGWRILFVPDSVIYHAYQLRFGPRKVFYQERNRYLTLLKALRWPTLLVLTPMLLFGELVTWGFVLLRDHARIGNKLRAYGWIIAHAKEIRLRRQTLRSSRRISDRLLLSMATSRIDFGQVESSGWMRFGFSALNFISTVLTRLTLALIR